MERRKSRFQKLVCAVLPRSGIGILCLFALICSPWKSSADDFSDRISDRAAIDAYGAVHQQTEERLEPAPYVPPRSRRPAGGFVSVKSPGLTPAEMKYFSRWTSPMAAPASFQAPFDSANHLQSPQFSEPASPSAKISAAAEFVQKQLSSLGLLETLVQSMILLGPDDSDSSTNLDLETFRNIGIPVDLLLHYRAPADEVMFQYLKRLAKDRRGQPSELEDGLKKVSFKFQPTKPGLGLSVEDGSSNPQLLRLQMGGGFRKGIIPGGSIEVSERLLQSFTNSSVVLTAPTEVATNMALTANATWKLSRSNQLTFITTPFPLAAWSQDNAKPAYYKNGSNQIEKITLIPRLSSQGEAVTTWHPGENAALQLLSNAGYSVIQSPLSFQGGNLLAIRDPSTQKRILITTETELRRNQRLGLNREEVLQAFQSEFGVDQVVVLPLVSFHLDYDLSIRVVGQEIRCLVNDPVAMARLIVDQGISQLATSSKLNPSKVESLKRAVASEHPGAAAREIQVLLRALQNSRGQYPGSLAKLFTLQPSDPATYNLQLFCTSVDLLEASDPQESSPTPPSYLESLKRTLEANGQLHEELKKLGWKLIPVPSMPDLYKSANYLNGIQARNKYVMPALGSYYSWLDYLVQNKIEAAFDQKIRVEVIPCADLQQNHGALHCVCSVYPESPE